jgi:hypothetical protein
MTRATGNSTSGSPAGATGPAFKGATPYLIVNKYVGFWQETVWLGRTTGETCDLAGKS